jgi:hypothetical protein
MRGATGELVCVYGTICISPQSLNTSVDLKKFFLLSFIFESHVCGGGHRYPRTTMALEIRDPLAHSNSRSSMKYER